MPVIAFFAFSGRTGRTGWAIWLAVFCATLAIGTVVASQTGGASLVAICGLIGLAAAKLTTQTVRRVHDCGQSGAIGFAAGVGILALLAAAAAHWLGQGADPIFWILILVALVAAAALFLRRAELRANRYGPAADTASSDARPSPAGAIAAIIWVAAGMALGFAALSWQAGMDRQREERMRMADPPAPPPPPATAARRTGVDADNDALSNRIDDLLKSEQPK